MTKTILFSGIAAILHVSALVLPASAQDDLGARLSIELNQTESRDAGCTLSFLVQNGHPADVTRAVFETVLFDAAGQVERLTLFDFGTLPAGRPRVRQFVVPDAKCEDLGRVLINGAETCEAEGLSADACTRDLRLDSRVGIEVIG
jgi:hypothetical protein